MKFNNYFFVAIAIGLMCVECRGQSFPQWGSLKKGRYEVGYSDTVIFKSDEQFSYHSFRGAKPFFIGIWYPSRNDSKKPYMHYKDYFNFESEKEYAVLLDSLKEAFRAVLMGSGILIDITPRDSIVIIPLGAGQKRLYEDVLNTSVGAKYNLKKPLNKFPCILYHHGAQSISFDNNVFCEYMASHGFVVISANFNLPDESGEDLLTIATDKRFGTVTDYQFVIEFVKRQAFVDSTRMTAVGHSLGAQISLRHDNQVHLKPFQKIIVLHTTLESQQLANARKKWISFNFLFDNQAQLSTTPTFILAPTLLMYRSKKNPITNKDEILNIDTRYPEFEPFRNNSTTPYTFITIRHAIKHNSFISLGNFRFPLLSKYELNDRNEIIKQQKTYERVVELTKKIITSPGIEVGRHFTTQHSKDFKFEFSNKK